MLVALRVSLRLHDLLDKLTESSPVLLSFEHLAVDGDLGIERLSRYTVA